ncbi:MAG: hypothetical protein HC900_07240 [Methylacidiphilales bacterium]|nr:hypothetical protein [Candidatus Methylacidiphilales bacterium]
MGEALRCLGDGGQDCVVFHLSLAEHHGIEALKALAGALAGTPVVVINGSGETVPAPAVRVGRMLGLDVRGPIPKPLGLAALRQALVQAIPTGPMAEPYPAATDEDPAGMAEGRAAPHGEARILFQPRIDLMTGAPVGCEVLVGGACAADHPAGVHPAGPLLRRALAACAGLVRRHGGFRVAVPATAAWLDDSSLAGDIEAALATAGVPAATLVLEIPTDRRDARARRASAPSLPGCAPGRAHRADRLRLRPAVA